MNPPQSVRLLDPLFTDERVAEIFCDRNRLQRMLDFEAALARALAHAGIAPKGSASVIAEQCNAERFDLGALARGAAPSGNPAIPMVKALTSLVSAADEKAAAYVHWGATSQDAIDTGMVLQLREALEWFDHGLRHLSETLAKIASEQETTIVAGRTWLQQGPPVTFGLKAAGWRSAIERHRSRFAQARARVLVLQFGGAVGTLSALGDRGMAVAEALAKELQLEAPDLPWHAHRDRPAEMATTMGLLAGTLGKIARDVSLMTQTEVDELAEPAGPGRGGSSTMPHKRNPVSSAVVLAAAIRVPALVSVMLSAMVQEHERGLGGWHAEWETLPEICLLTAGAVSHTTQILDGLEIHAKTMERNLSITHGLILAEAVSFALGKQIGKQAAHHVVEQACRRAVKENRHLREVLMETSEVSSRLSGEEIAHLLNPKNYLGSAAQMTQNALPHPPDNPDKKT